MVAEITTGKNVISALKYNNNKLEAEKQRKL